MAETLDEFIERNGGNEPFTPVQWARVVECFSAPLPPLPRRRSDPDTTAVAS